MIGGTRSGGGMILRPITLIGLLTCCCLVIDQITSPRPQQSPFQLLRPATGTTGSVFEIRTHHIQPLNGYFNFNKYGQCCMLSLLPLQPQTKVKGDAEGLLNGSPVYGPRPKRELRLVDLLG